MFNNNFSLCNKNSAFGQQTTRIQQTLAKNMQNYLQEIRRYKKRTKSECSCP